MIFNFYTTLSFTNYSIIALMQNVKEFELPRVYGWLEFSLPKTNYITLLTLSILVIFKSKLG
jgi:hypothetical protein